MWDFFIENHANIYLLIGILSVLFYLLHLSGNLTRISLCVEFLTLVLGWYTVMSIIFAATVWIAFPTEMLKSESESKGKVLFPLITWAHQDEVAVMNFPLLKWKYLPKSYLKRMAFCRPLYFQSKMISSLPYPPTHKRDHFSAIFKNEALVDQDIPLAVSLGCSAYVLPCYFCPFVFLNCTQDDDTLKWVFFCFISFMVI